MLASLQPGEQLGQESAVWTASLCFRAVTASCLTASLLGLLNSCPPSLVELLDSGVVARLASGCGAAVFGAAAAVGQLQRLAAEQLSRAHQRPAAEAVVCLVGQLL